jgi:hypothetical protein
LLLETFNESAGQRIAMNKAPQILVARKRNDEYALNIKLWRRVTVFIMTLATI